MGGVNLGRELTNSKQTNKQRQLYDYRNHYNDSNSSNARSAIRISFNQVEEKGAISRNAGLIHSGRERRRERREREKL